MSVGSAASGPSNCRDPRDATDWPRRVGDSCRWLQVAMDLGYVLKMSTTVPVLQTLKVLLFSEDQR